MQVLLAPEVGEAARGKVRDFRLPIDFRFTQKRRKQSRPGLRSLMSSRTPAVLFVAQLALFKRRLVL